MQCYKNGQLVSAVSVNDRGFHYGDGCFTTARVRSGKIELRELHDARLNRALIQLKLRTDLTVLDQTLNQMHVDSGSVNGTLKIIISRGEGQRGYSLPSQTADLWVFFYPQHVTDFQYEIFESGVLNQAMGLSMPQLVGIKTLNRLEQVMLKAEADQQQWKEALVTDVQGNVVEGVSSNCFIRINDSWICPELRYNGVHGVMRAEILSRMQQFGVKVQHRSVDMMEIEQFQSLFFCNALSPMKIVSKLDAKSLDVQPCIELFRSLHLNQIS